MKSRQFSPLMQQWFFQATKTRQEWIKRIDEQKQFVRGLFKRRSSLEAQLRVTDPDFHDFLLDEIDEVQSKIDLAQSIVGLYEKCRDSSMRAYLKAKDNPFSIDI